MKYTQQHGWERQFDPNGQVAEERLYEFGIVTRQASQPGDARAEWALPSDDEQFALVERYRSERQWPAPDTYATRSI